ncbi:MAG TPA: thermonuclease family protein [Dehalococcoidia bacterium]|nr:thermonuclease family protein [Dehalococcoidia bacterium]
MRLRARRLPAWAFVLLLIGSVTLVTGIPYAIASKDARAPDWEQVRTSLPLPPGVSIGQLEKATVYDVIDGDTIDVLIDRRLERVRYFGVDTPEVGADCYRDAVERNRRLTGRTVYLLPDARERDRFGRLLRYVFKEDGTSVDATLVAEGMGLAWREDGRYRDQIVGLEQEARAAGRGCLWKAD